MADTHVQLDDTARDPLPRRLWRAVRVGTRSGMAGDLLNPFPLPGVAALVLRQGLGARTIHAAVARIKPRRVALVDERQQWTYAELNDTINRCANNLHDDLGVRRKTPVAIMMENRGEYVALWFALFRLGATTVHAGYRMTPDELQYQIEHSGAELVAASARTLAVAREVADRRRAAGGRLRIIVVGDDATPEGTEELAWNTIAAAGSTAFPPNPQRQAINENVVYTSGTTGKPKGAVRDFAAVGPTDLFRLLERIPMHAGDRHMVVSPLYHSAGQAFTLLATAVGSTIYMRPHFEPADTLEHMSRHAIQSIFLVPTMTRRILDLPEDFLNQHPTPELRAIISGAAEFPHALRTRAIEHFGVDCIYDFYGATELGWVTLLDGREMLRKPGTVGRPLPGQAIRILDENRNRLPPGEVGLVYVQNEQTMLGYLHDEDATRAGLHEGWVTVEDLGHLDEDGYLFLGGRARDMVISGGVNIYPVEIEEVLAQHPDIREVAVVGLPDPEWGERLAGIVVVRDPDRAPDPAGIEQFAKERLSGYKVPRSWYFLDELPRNMTGKVLKRELRERFADHES